MNKADCEPVNYHSFLSMSSEPHCYCILEFRLQLAVARPIKFLKNRTLPCCVFSGPCKAYKRPLVVKNY